MRKISRDKYIIAALITAGIFLLGFFLGLVIEGERIRYTESISKIQNLDFASLQIQYAYIDELSQEENCYAVEKTFEENINNLETTRERIEDFDENAKINKEEFDLLKREYLLAQLRYWLLAMRTKNLCDQDIISLLYFFSDDKICPDCNSQSFVLTYLKKRFKERLLIFSFDESFEEEPMISLLKHVYNITSYPALVIEGKLHEGLKDKKQLLNIICDYYQEEIKDCVSYKNVGERNKED